MILADLALNFFSRNAKQEINLTLPKNNQYFLSVLSYFFQNY